MHNSDYYTIKSDSYQIDIDKETVAIIITIGHEIWKTFDKDASCTLISDDQAYTLSFSDAQNKRFTEYRSGSFVGTIIVLDQWRNSTPAAEQIEITLSVKLNTTTGEIVCELHKAECKTNNAEDYIETVRWPASFDLNSSSGLDYTAVPAMQGYLIPADWEKPIIRYEQGMMFSRDAYMPWWGQKRGEFGYTAIIDTPWDAKCTLTHEANSGTKASVEWLSSLDTFDYTRRVKFLFEDQINYVKMAKTYRSYLKKNGRFRSIEEKIAANPLAANLIGSAIVHTSIHYHILPESHYFNLEQPEQNDRLVTFDRRAEQLQELRLKTDLPLYVHVDGWGKRGYDNLHPDILPPSPLGGGWEGFQRLQNACKELNILLALHDQYRDFYLDADSYDESLVVKDRHQAHKIWTEWYGGAQSFMCPSLTKGYIERNYDELKKGGIEPDGVYLDVFAVVPLEECHDPVHRITRLECMKHRTESFYEIQSRGMIVSSEEPIDWAIPHLHLVHHGPYALIPDPGKGPSIGVPVPLLSLVYHDSIILPWSLDIGEWGIPETDWGYLHGLLNAGIPYLSIEPTEEQLQLVKQMAALHKRVGRLEMTDHRFIDGNPRHQRSQFADGTAIEINLDSNEYVINYAEQSFTYEK